MESGDQFFATICAGHILRSVEAKHVSKWPPQLDKAPYFIALFHYPNWLTLTETSIDLEIPKWALGCRLQETYLRRTKFNNKYQNDLHLASLGWHLYIFKCLYIRLRHIYFWTFINDHPVYTGWFISSATNSNAIISRWVGNRSIKFAGIL